jgi:cell division protein FtsL
MFGAQRRMRKTVVVLGLTVLLLVGVVAWQVAAAYLANSELQSDMNDLAAQNSARIGLSQIASEDELRDSVISKAKEHGIQLQSEQVIVHRTFTPGMLGISLSVDYAAPINLLVFSFTIRFAPSSVHYAEVIVK